MMNVFRFVADMLHLASFAVLLLYMFQNSSARGLSRKTQELYLIVFLTRYIDLFFHFVSLYNTVMKMLYIGLTGYTVYLMTADKKFSRTYDKEHDTFMHWKLAVLPCLVLAVVWNEAWWNLTGVSGLRWFKWWTVEWLWAFSIFLEAIAIFPQLIVLERGQDLTSITGLYVLCLGSYRALYIVNWIWRYWAEGYIDYIAVFGGVVQTLLYTDFFYRYFKALNAGLPGAKERAPGQAAKFGLSVFQTLSALGRTAVKQVTTAAKQVAAKKAPARARPD